MKRFFIKLSIMICLVLGAILLANVFYKHSYHYRNEAGLNKFNTIPDGIEIANVGSSHGFYNFNYSNWTKYVTFNFGLTGQRHFYSLQILKTYKNKLKKKQ